MAEAAAGERLTMLSNAWLLLALRLAGRALPEPMKEPEKATEETAAETVSLVSMSVTVIEPVVLRVVSVSVREAASAPSVMTGLSLVPVIVIVTVLEPPSGVLSSSVAVIV